MKQRAQKACALLRRGMPACCCHLLELPALQPSPASIAPAHRRWRLGASQVIAEGIQQLKCCSHRNKRSKKEPRAVCEPAVSALPICPCSSGGSRVNRLCMLKRPLPPHLRLQDKGHGSFMSDTDAPRAQTAGCASRVQIIFSDVYTIGTCEQHEPALPCAGRQPTVVSHLLLASVP